MDEIEVEYPLLIPQISHLRMLPIPRNATLPVRLKAVREGLEVQGADKVELDRKSIWLSTVEHFALKTADWIRGHSLEVKFVDEVGVDGGGPHDEWVLKLLEEVLDPVTGLFMETSNGYLMPSPYGRAVPAYKLHYRVFGRLLGKFFINNEYSRSVPLCPYILKLIRG